MDASSCLCGRTLRSHCVSTTRTAASAGRRPARRRPVGTKDIGDPLGSTAGLLTVSGDPNERSIVDINASLVLRFSEPVDASTIPAALVVTDDAGSRVFGRLVTSEDGTSVSFTSAPPVALTARAIDTVSRRRRSRAAARGCGRRSAHQFTTFQPSVVGSLAHRPTRGTSPSAAPRPSSRPPPASPRSTSRRLERRAWLPQTAIPGGANGVTILSGAPITDRNGQSHAGPIALVASGGTSTAGSLEASTCTTPASPAALGSTQLTNAPGQTPPAGVPAFVGMPQRDCRRRRRPRLCRDRGCRRLVGPDWTSDPARRSRARARRRRRAIRRLAPKARMTSLALGIVCSSQASPA